MRKAWDQDDLAEGRQHCVDVVHDLLRGRVPVGSRVLDFGCGPGRVAEAMVDAYEMFGTDTSDEMMKWAHIPTIPYGHLLQYRSDFAAAYSVLVIQHLGVAQLLCAFADISRVLCDAGFFAFQFVASVNHHEEHGEFSHSYGPAFLQQTCNAFGMVEVDLRIDERMPGWSWRLYRKVAQ